MPAGRLSSSAIQRLNATNTAGDTVRISAMRPVAESLRLQAQSLVQTVAVFQL
jgi:hypothetical protein